MFGKKFLFTKLVILLCLLSLIHGKKCVVKPKNKEIKNIEKINNEIGTTLPLKNEIDSGSDSDLNSNSESDTEFEDNIKTITDSEAIEISSSTIEISSSTLIPTETEAIVFTSTTEVSSSTLIPTETEAIVFTSTTEVYSSTLIPTETEAIVFTSTNKIDEPTITSSPTPTETIEEYEELIEYDLKIKLDNTEEFRDTLNYLKNKYPEYFKNYNSSSDYICDDQCFLNKLALVKLANDIKAFIDENKYLLNELQLYDYERSDFKVSHDNLPPDEVCKYYFLVFPIQYDKDFNGYFAIFTFSNDAVMEKVQKKFEKYVVSCTKLDRIEKEDFDFE
ncbi:hypothetical protein BCR32DRAFT_328932 [Anaeromyces robustus]|uniref:Uncharacterized protein n=1 Tax=Anaeromyces robustus TaxID=1754192 RepID=A0A1Y1WV55_9FUNG|nr:hypothetical protein BCR32DRAFT_328932 [Anaeromyces robustus]|eukprot:ORX77437.1 hypothetical protein BCR32DRAFT_328932 [Anaeromyces robustus]